MDTIGTFEDTHVPALIRNHYGRGIAILSAVPLGGSYYNKPDNPVHQLLLDFARKAGVTSEAQFVSRDGGFLNLKVHTLNDGYVVYAINQENESRAGVLEVSVGDRVIKRVKNIVSDQEVTFQQRDGKLRMPLEVGGKQVVVFSLSH